MKEEKVSKRGGGEGKELEKKKVVDEEREVVYSRLPGAVGDG